MIKDIKRMMEMDKETVTFRRIGRAIANRLKAIPPTISWVLFSEKNRSNLRKYKNIHKGERCFIIGNGPSLNKMDLKLLKNEYTFGQNRIYMLFDKIGFKTTYHVTVNELVIKQFHTEMKELNIPSFVPWKFKNIFSNFSNYSYLYQDFNEEFSVDIAKRLGNGGTVTYSSMQLAYYMGFSEVYLIGVDHNFAEKELGKVVVSKGDDPNHFDPNYFGKGVKWGLANLPQSERGYSLAKLACEKDGRKIYDATIDGKLKIFEKFDYLQLFEKEK